MNEAKDPFFNHLDKSAIFTFIGIVLLFSASVIVVLISPSYVDPTWTNPSSTYQIQMYEVSDPNIYFGTTYKGNSSLQAVYHLKEGFTLLAFQESEAVKIVAPPDLSKYVTSSSDPRLKLTFKLLLLRKPQPQKEEGAFDPLAEAAKVRHEAQNKWEKEHPEWKKQNLIRPEIEVLELYAAGNQEAFAVAPVDTVLENWVDKENFEILNKPSVEPYPTSEGVIYIQNPREYRLRQVRFGDSLTWQYHPDGNPIKTLDALKSHPLIFKSRQELIQEGEHRFAAEGCWYCHTDQTRTLVQDTVLNGSAAYPAPPSSANEYIYQHITFPGTKRNGPDLSRVGIKRPGRDWHRGHFWAPKTASEGSIMPAFRHFFDDDPRGIVPSVNIPNHQFESIYQYLMTKGTRITPPTQAWWNGKDPIDTKAIIEGKRVIAN
jgi:cytochrome c oxidase cbb3-type subunit 2